MVNFAGNLLEHSVYEKQSATVCGATGLVGRALIDRLLHDDRYWRVTAVVRSGTSLPSHHKLHLVYTQFDKNDWFAALQANHVYCCLGTTIKKAGSKQAFRWVDYTLVVEAATVAAHYQAHFLVISALGADPSSSIFYNRVKGEMEQALLQLPLPKLSIFRPSLLSGKRKEFRFGERIALWFAWMLPEAWRSIPSEKVAIAMEYVAFNQSARQQVYSSKAMQAIPDLRKK